MDNLLYTKKNLCSSNKLLKRRKYCQCVSGLFSGYDCNWCDYDEMIFLQRHHSDDSQLRKVSNSQEINGLVDINNDDSQLRKKIVQMILMEEKERFLRNRVEVRHGSNGTVYVEVANKEEEEELVDKCLELAHDYDACGYRKFKKDYDNKSFYSQGRLLEGNDRVRIRVVVGEVINYVSPSREVEQIIDKYVKAIAIMEIWKTEEDFLKDWDKRVFTGVRETSNDRYVYMGWKMKLYFGWDMSKLVDLKNTVEHQEKLGEKEACSKQFDRKTLSDFWNNALNTVRALQLMDRLNEWALDHAHNPLDSEPFVFGFDS